MDLLLQIINSNLSFISNIKILASHFILIIVHINILLAFFFSFTIE